MLRLRKLPPPSPNPALKDEACGSPSLWVTSQSLRGVCALRLQDCPGGGTIKTADAYHCRQTFYYRIAPVGARSKRRKGGGGAIDVITGLPRWGHDQNMHRWHKVAWLILQDCPCGGTIKTGSRTRSAHP